MAGGKVTAGGAPLLATADRVLFAGLIDYAGLFPPTSLSMADAVAEYREARTGSWAWMLARFICPASRLAELGGTLMATMRAGEEPWQISTLFDGDAAASTSAAQAFDSELGPAAVISLVEARLPDATLAVDDVPSVDSLIGHVVAAALATGERVIPFFEVPRGPRWDDALPTVMAALSARRIATRRPMGAKIRCGGATPGDFPSPDEVAGFLVGCRGAGLPWKATAGLHHPVRHHDDEIGVMRHGFLNLLVAASLVAQDAGRDDVVAALEETDEGAFDLGPASMRWRDRRLSAAVLREVRAAHFPSYGSCSFAEPIEDLVALGMLEAPA